MHTARRRVVTEFLWLTLSLALTLVLAIVLFGWTFLKAEVSSWLPLTSLFFTMTLVIYLVKAFNAKPTA